jgi:hypothetical protein
MWFQATSKDGKEAGIEVVEVPEKSRIPGERVYFEGSEFEGKHQHGIPSVSIS